MSDEFYEVTHESWFGRIMSSIKSVIFGIILFIIAFPVLWFNEGRAVKRAKSLEEGKGNVVAIDAKVDASNDKKLVHVSAEAVALSTVTDQDFGISYEGLKLIRKAEMYQWKEKKESKSEKQLGGGKETVTRYTYNKGWYDKKIDSSRFKHQGGHTNPNTMKHTSKTISSKAKLGEFTLSKQMVGRLTGSESYYIEEDMVKGTLNVTPDRKIIDGGIYFGNDPQNPQIGDIRISYSVLPNSSVSVVARQVRDTFEPYVTSNGGKISLISTGTLSAENMFQTAQDKNTTLTWILRGVGFLMMTIGLAMVLSPLVVIADVIPFIGDLVGMSLGLCAALVAGALSFLTIALAWLTYRPLVGGTCLVIAFALILGPKFIKKSSG